MNATATSPVSALVNAEATLVGTINKVTSLVDQVGTVDLPAAMEDLGVAVDRARHRLKAAQLLMNGMVVGLVNDFLSLSADIEADLSLSSGVERIPAMPSEEGAKEPVAPLPLPPVQETQPQATPRNQEEATVITVNPTPEETDPFASAEQSWTDSYHADNGEESGTAYVATAALSPAEEPVTAPLTPLQGDGADVPTVETSESGKRPRGKRGVAKAKVKAGKYVAPPAGCDVNYPRDHAERILLVEAGSLTLDELAERVSLWNQEEAVVVRDHTANPITYSKVYFKGKTVKPSPSRKK